MKKQELSNEVEVNIIEIIKLFLKKSVFILLVGAIFAVAFGVGTKLLVTPMYRSETSLYVLADSEKGDLTNSDVNKNTMLTKDYVALIKSRLVMEDVIQKNDLSMSPSALRGATNVKILQGTRVIVIDVVNSDPEMARKLADNIREVGSKRIEHVMDTQPVKVVDTADLPKSPISPNLKRNVLSGAVLGCVLMMVIIIIRFIMDDSVKNDDDVEQYLGLSVLGSIPVDSKLKKEHKKRGSK